MFFCRIEMETFHLIEARPASPDQQETAPAEREETGRGGGPGKGKPQGRPRPGSPRLAKKRDCGVGGF